MRLHAYFPQGSSCWSGMARSCLLSRRTSPLGRETRRCSQPGNGYHRYTGCRPTCSRGDSTCQRWSTGCRHRRSSRLHSSCTCPLDTRCLTPVFRSSCQLHTECCPPCSLRGSACRLPNTERLWQESRSMTHLGRGTERRSRLGNSCHRVLRKCIAADCQLRRQDSGCSCG